MHAHVKDRVSVGFMFALFSCFSAGEIIPRVWTRVRVEDRVRLRVFFKRQIVVFVVYLDHAILKLSVTLRITVELFSRFIAMLCFNPFTAICFLRDKFYFGFCVVISASLTLTLAK